MNVVACPHCGTKRIVARVPKDWVAILKCPNCNELVVLFRGKVIGVDRETLERGTFEERKSHIAEIITEFLEPSMFGISEESAEQHGRRRSDSEELGVEAISESPVKQPITTREVDRFVRVELKRIDEAKYFHRYFD